MKYLPALLVKKEQRYILVNAVKNTKSKTNKIHSFALNLLVASDQALIVMEPAQNVVNIKLPLVQNIIVLNRIA